MRKYLYKILLVLIIFNIIAPAAVYAYIDPGTGSMVLQIIAASILGLGITFRAWFQKFKDLVFKGHKKDGSDK